MKKDIYRILSGNDTVPAVINISPSESWGIYSYQKNIYVLKDGEDIEFDSFKLSEKVTIHDKLIRGEYEFNSTFQ